MTDSILTTFLNLSRKCKEYAVLPHVDTPTHEIVSVVGDALGLCKCFVERVYAKKAREAIAVPFDEDASRFTLLVNPHIRTAWNRRRQALLDGLLLPSEDLQLTGLILATFPRSTETLFHRQLADAYKMNYAVWDYRRQLLTVGLPSMYQPEVDRIRDWLRFHPTDSSGWSYLAWAVTLLVRTFDSDSQSALGLILRDLEETRETLSLYPERECLWLYRRTLLHLFKQTTDGVSVKVPSSFWTPALRRTMEALMDKYCNVDGDIHDVGRFNLVPQFLKWCQARGIEGPSTGHGSDADWLTVLLLRTCRWLTLGSWLCD